VKLTPNSVKKWCKALEKKNRLFRHGLWQRDMRQSNRRLLNDQGRIIDLYIDTNGLRIAKLASALPSRDQMRVSA
jgi:hypothetical protein